MKLSVTIKHTIIASIVILLTASLSAQTINFTRQDTLRGSITPEREWWDLVYYHLNIVVNPSDSTIKGTNTVTYKVINPYSTMQIDLQEPMNLYSATINDNQQKFTGEGNVYWIKIGEEQVSGEIYSIVLSYGGKPRVSTRPPWVGGITWKKDRNGLPFIASACQGDGASLWWPCKDHMYDEPDSMLISVNVPDNLIDVSNGRLKSVESKPDKTKTYNWFVANPINNYGVNINIGDYVHFSEVFKGEKGNLDCDYYVLRDNLDKAKEQFKQAPMMLKAFEYWFGPYPFYEDGYKLVEAPYLGMEHQSSVTYGNGFKNGYMGTDLSRTGWGLKFDFIIIHESGHEWFANSITYKDIADMWVHESFINYSENLYVEYYFGKQAGSEYVIGTRKNIKNDRPIIGKYDVNNEGSGDMYYKGGNMLHTIRQIINDDEKWRGILRGLSKDFYHKVVTGEQIENYMIDRSGLNLRPIFNQYLRDKRLPDFEYYINGKELFFRFNNCIKGFEMPLRIFINGKAKNITPNTAYSAIRLKAGIEEIKVDPGYYVNAVKIKVR